MRLGMFVAFSFSLALDNGFWVWDGMADRMTGFELKILDVRMSSTSHCVAFFSGSIVGWCFFLLRQRR